MALTIVETRAITGGAGTHAGTHVAAALDPIGGLLGVREFPVTPTGAVCAGSNPARAHNSNACSTKSVNGPADLVTPDTLFEKQVTLTSAAIRLNGFDGSADAGQSPSARGLLSDARRAIRFSSGMTGARRTSDNQGAW
jgi:hypothetical protein